MGVQADWDAVDSLMLKALAAAEKVARYRHAQLSAVRLVGDLNARPENVNFEELLESIKAEWTELGPLVGLELDAVVRVAQQRGERRLALLYRRAPQVLTIQLEQVEGAEHRRRVVPVAADQVEGGEPIVVAHYGLAIDQAGARPQQGDRGRDLREATGEVDAVSARSFIPPYNICCWKRCVRFTRQQAPSIASVNSQPSNPTICPSLQRQRHFTARAHSSGNERYTPFWISSLLSRIVFFVLPVVAVLIPLVGFTLSSYRWVHIRRAGRRNRQG
jgi:hypothetical protein